MRTPTYLLTAAFLAPALAAAPIGDGTPWVVKALRADGFYDSGFEREPTIEEWDQVRVLAKAEKARVLKWRAQYALARQAGQVFVENSPERERTVVPPAVPVALRYLEGKLASRPVRRLLTAGLTWCRVQPDVPRAGMVRVSFEHVSHVPTPGPDGKPIGLHAIHGAVHVDYDPKSRTASDLAGWGEFAE